MVCVTAVWMGKKQIWEQCVSKSFWYLLLIYNSGTGYIRHSLVGLIHWGYKSAAVDQLQTLSLKWSYRGWCTLLEIDVLAKMATLKNTPESIVMFLTKLLPYLQKILWSTLGHLSPQRVWKLTFPLPLKSKDLWDGDTTALHSRVWTWRCT